MVDMYCLRRVSRTFRRFIYEPELRSQVLGSLESELQKNTEVSWEISRENQQELRQRLQRDGMCSMCLSRREFPVNGFRAWSGPGCDPEDALGAAPWYHCRFTSVERPARLHCHGCGTHHDARSFSPSDAISKAPRLCLGKQGSVRLWEHVRIRWGEIADHLAGWQKHNTGGSLHA